jgi:predicted acyltransferase
MKVEVTKQNRIASIDALRGFDMLFIIVLDHFFSALNVGVKSLFTMAVAKQFDHPEWFGSSLYDIVMPLFLFIVGAAIPFALSKRKQEDSSMSALYAKLIRRFVILFILGWIVQGHLLELNINTFSIFSNTLQAIAVGYLFSSIAYLHFKLNTRILIFASCLIIYTLLLIIPDVPGIGRGVLLPGSSYAWYVDQQIFGRFQDGTQYTWLLSGFGFIATTLSGVFAGELIKSDLPRTKVAFYLFLIGVAGVMAGMLLGIWHPIIKKLWTSSFVLASSGVCFLLLALFYWIIDVKGKVKWAFPLKVIGMNAIVAYVLSHVFNFHLIAEMVLYGLKQFVGEFNYLVLTVGGFGILYLILWYMYKNKTFIKV